MNTNKMTIDYVDLLSIVLKLTTEPFLLINTLYNILLESDINAGQSDLTLIRANKLSQILSTSPLLDNPDIDKNVVESLYKQLDELCTTYISI